MNMDRMYRAAIYVRLSKEDGDSFAFGKNESDSITNQKLLIQSYLAKQPDIEVVETLEDDGYTCTNFERPGFQKLLDATIAEPAMARSIPIRLPNVSRFFPIRTGVSRH